MSDGMTTLKSIGAQKIHEQTHIARQHAQAILHESFDDMTRVQFLGFISILEREYGLNLDELKLSAEEYYTQENSHAQDVKKVFVVPERKKRYTLVYLAVAAIVFVVAVLFNMNSSSSSSQEIKIEVLNNEAIDDAKVNIQNTDSDIVLEVLEVNVTAEEDIVTDEINVTIEEIVEPVAVVKSLKILPTKRLWLGYMDIETRKKKQTTFKGELDLDPTKDWLFTLGHGHVDVEIDGKIIKFKSRYNIKLLYKDSEIKKIDFKEYKKINRGTKW